MPRDPDVKCLITAEWPVFGYIGPSNKASHRTASLLSGLVGIWTRESTIPPWCLRSVGTMLSLLNLTIRR
jgi:hypothetical protein